MGIAHGETTGKAKASVVTGHRSQVPGMHA